MANSTNLTLPFLEAAQAQKHVTLNEALLALDTLVQPNVLDRDIAAPPGSPADGDRYIVGSSATGDWAGKDFDIAVWQDGLWKFFDPRHGWFVWVQDESVLLVYDGAAWQLFTDVAGFVALAINTTVSISPNNARNNMVIAEEQLTALSGANVDTSIVIPDRAIVFGVSVRTTAAITGASSYDCGIAGETDKFGGLLNIAQDSTNAGVIGPTAFYADTPIRLTANGSNFTGGAVRVAIHYYQPQVPQS